MRSVLSIGIIAMVLLCIITNSIVRTYVVHVYIIIIIIIYLFIINFYRNTRYNKIAHYYHYYYIHCMHCNSTYYYLRYSHESYAADPLTKMALATDLTRDMLRRLYISFRTLDLGLARWMAINEARREKTA